MGELNVGSIPAGNDLCDLTCVRSLGNVRKPAFRLIRFLPNAHPCGLRLGRSTPVGSIPAGNDISDILCISGSTDADRSRNQLATQRESV